MKTAHLNRQINHYSRKFRFPRKFQRMYKQDDGFKESRIYFKQESKSLGRRDEIAHNLVSHWQPAERKEKTRASSNGVLIN